MKLIILLFLLGPALNSFSQKKQLKVEFDINYSDSLGVDADSILIIGVGNTLSRIFLENVSHNLIAGLGKKSVIANYHFFGSQGEDASKSYDTLNKSGYRAVLFFMPKGWSVFDVQGKLVRRSLRTPDNYHLNSTSAKFKMIFEQDFEIMLYRFREDLSKVWAGFASVSCDPSKTTVPKQLAYKILSQLEMVKATRNQFSPVHKD